MRAGMFVRAAGAVAAVAWALVSTGVAQAVDPSETRISDYVIDYDAASFWFEAVPSAEGFQCRLDGGDWVGCSSPAEYRELAVGPHSFEVRAIAADGSVDESPANLGWHASERPVPPPPAPANDNWYGAESVSGTSGSVAGTNVNATRQWDEPFNPLGGDHSVWYAWTAGRDASVTFTATSAEFSPVVAAYVDGSAEWKSPVAYGSGSTTFRTWAGVTYKIAVDGATTGAFELSWAYESTGPANDYFAEAEVLSGAEGAVAGSTVGATVEWNEPRHDGGAGLNEGHSIWYRWTAPATGSAFFTTQGSSFDTTLRAYSGNAPHALTGLGWYEADVNPWSTWSRLQVQVSEGQTLYLAVDGQNGETGEVALGWRTTVDTGDTTWPTVELLSPQPGEIVGGTVTFVADAWDDEGIDRVEYRLATPDSEWWYVGEAYAPAYEVTLDTSVLEPGVYNVIATAFDSSGNSAGTSVDIWVESAPPPTLVVPREVRAEATGPTGGLVAFEATAHDYTGAALPVGCAPASGSLFRLGVTRVVCSAVDAWGNRVSGTIRVFVTDTTPPVLTLPADTAIDAVSPTGAPYEFVATAQDLVSGAVPVACLPGPSSVFALGDTTVTCTAADDRGNTVEGAFVVHVRGALEQVGELRALVAAINLRKLGDRRFEDQLADVERHLADQRLNAACGGLADFADRAARESGRRLTADESRRLVEDATRIRAVIPC